MWRTGSLVVLCLLVPHALGEDPEIDVVSYTSPSPLEDVAFHASEEARRARASSADASSAASEVYARFDAETADRSVLATDQSLRRTTEDGTAVKGAILEEFDALAGAQDAAAKAQKYFQIGAASAGNVESDAAAAGSSGLSHLSPLYKKYTDWKWQMFHDPLKEATAAGQRAAAPFNQALQVVEKRRDAYEERAKFLSSTAQTLKTVAFGTAVGAVGKQAIGLGESAQKDMQNAHHMVLQAQLYEANSIKLIGQAQMWAANIPAYQGAVDGATHAAEHSFMKTVYAPPPVAPMGGGPPPPTGSMLPVLIQKSK